MDCSSRDSLTFHLCLKLGVYLSDLLITLSRLRNRNKTLKGGQGVTVIIGQMWGIPGLASFIILSYLSPCSQHRRWPGRTVSFWYFCLGFSGSVTLQVLLQKFILKTCLLSTNCDVYYPVLNYYYFFLCGSCLPKVRIIIMYMLNLDLIFALETISFTQGSQELSKTGDCVDWDPGIEESRLQNQPARKLITGHFRMS